jgi:hypothetical protein
LRQKLVGITSLFLVRLTSLMYSPPASGQGDWGATTVESHGGYVCQYEDVDASWLQRLARQALSEDGEAPEEVGLLVTVMGGPRIVRFAWDAPFTYGRAGARWYLAHHALARRLTEHLRVTVHAYSFDPDEGEQVVAWADGRRVGGDALRYAEAELVDDEAGDDEQAFRRLQSRWPLGHVARVLGIAREQLLRIPRQTTALISLDAPLEPQPLWQLLPPAVWPRPSQPLLARSH